MSNMNNQTEWAQRAANVSRASWSDFISSRIDVAMERASRDPNYQEFQEFQKKSEEEVDKLLEKLNEDERTAIRRHYERQTSLENYELEEAYMLGIRDAVQFLSWLDVFQAKEWM